MSVLAAVREREARRVREPARCTVEHFGDGRERLHGARPDAGLQQELGKAAGPASRAAASVPWRRRRNTSERRTSWCAGILQARELAQDALRLAERAPAPRSARARRGGRSGHGSRRPGGPRSRRAAPPRSCARLPRSSGNGAPAAGPCSSLAAPPSRRRRWQRRIRAGRGRKPSWTARCPPWRPAGWCGQARAVDARAFAELHQLGRRVPRMASPASADGETQLALAARGRA